jgi:hypothetical protein
MNMAMGVSPFDFAWVETAADSAHSALLLYIHCYYRAFWTDTIDNPVRAGQQYSITTGSMEAWYE